ncbi:MAG: hypothetical protein KC467_09080 [Marinomonas atlantica]|nr:hypothetical protein [Marinomonas atlantica]
MKATITFLCFTLIAFSQPALALVLQYQSKVVILSQQELVENSNITHEMYGPFRRQTVIYEGYNLSQFLQLHLQVDAKTVVIDAIDGYKMTLKNIDSRPLMLVLKEDGRPLSIREHGPARVIETDLGGKDVRNISLFDDWIWMIKKIEVVDG